MIVVGLDLETTGTDKNQDRPIEVGLSLWTTNFNRGLDSRAFLVQSDGVKVDQEVTKITGLTQAMVDRFGYTPQEGFEMTLEWVERAEAIVAFNGKRFDLPMLYQWAKRLGVAFPEKLVIDPFTDLPETNESVTPGMRPQELITMCAKEGIYYDAHEAGADVGAMLRLMAKRNFEFVLQRAKSPEVVIKSCQARSQNDRVKKHKFRWHPDRKIWWKAVKEIDLDTLVRSVNNEFGLERLDLKTEDMETDE